MKQNSRQSTASYYRTLYSKYRVDDACLQTRKQRRATGAFLEQLEINHLKPDDVVPKRQLRRLNRAFRDTPFIKIISATISVAALLLAFQAPAVMANTVDSEQDSYVSLMEEKGYQSVVMDDEASDIESAEKRPFDAVSLHLITQKAAYTPVSFETKNAVAMDEDSDVPSKIDRGQSLTVIDTSIDDWQAIKEAVKDGEILLLEGEEPLAAMIDKLQTMGQVDALSIFTHGDSGVLYFDGKAVSANHLEQQSKQWRQLGSYLSKEGDIHLFGCNVAQGAEGKAFVNELAEVTGADVAASINPTGNTENGGDWSLELAKGDVGELKAMNLASLKGFKGILAWTGMIDFSQVQNVGSYAGGAANNAAVYNDAGKAYTLIGDGLLDGTYHAGAWGAAYYKIYTNADQGTNGAQESQLTLYFSGNPAFDASSINIRNCSGGTKTFKFTSDQSDLTTSGALADLASEAVSLAGFSGITKLYITNNAGGMIGCIGVDDFSVVNVSNNTAPTIGGTSAGQAVNDTATISLFSAVTIADADNVTTTVTLDVNAKGVFTPASLVASGFTGTGPYTLASTTAGSAQTAIRQLVFDPADNRVAAGSTETTTFTIGVNDSTVTTNNNTTTVISTSVNDAPSFSAGATLTAVNEDTASPAGATVTTLLNANFTDVDPSSSMAGIAVSADASVNGTEGDWEYTTDGSTWYDIGTVSTSSALLLSSATKLRFVPFTNYNGTPGSLTVYAVDGSSATTFTSGASRQTFDTTGDGATSKVSAAGVAVGTSINAVNDAPTLTAFGAALGATNEDTEVAITLANIQAQGDEADVEDGTVSKFVIKAVSTGTLKIGATSGSALPWAATTNDTVDGANNAYWTPAADASGSLNAFTVVAEDSAAAESTPAVQATITVTAVNDDPAIAGLPTDVVVTEDTASDVNLSAATFSDADSGANSITLTIAASAGTLAATSGGDVTVGGSGTGTLTLDGTVSNIDTFLNTASNIQYTTAANVQGNNVATLTLTANDGGNTGTGGGGDVALGTVNINSTEVGDVPSVTAANGTGSMLEDTQTTSGLVLSRNVVDSTSVTHFKITNITNGSLFKNDGSTAIVNNDFITFAEGNAGLKFTPATDSTSSGSFNIQAGTDGAGGGLSASAATATITITPVNDAPVAAGIHTDSVNYVVGGSAVELDSSADATLSDIDSADFNGGNVTVAITANGTAAEDVLQVGTVGAIGTSASDVTHTDGFTIGTFTGGTSGVNLVVTLNANATVARVRDLLSAVQYNNTNGSPSMLSRTVAIDVVDGDGTANGGADAATTQTVTVNLVTAPILDLDADDSSGNSSNGFNGSFSEGGGAVAVTDTDTTISDDGSTHTSLTVTLTARPDGDGVESLSSTVVNGATVGADVVTVAAYVPATGVLQFTAAGGDGDGFLNDTTITTLMESIRYNNSSQAPNTANRNIDFVAVDSSAYTGATSTAVISVTAVNDPPAFTGLDGTPAYTEGGATVVLDANVTVADAELDAANNYNGATLTLVRNGGANANDQFSESGSLSALTEGNPFNLGAGDIGTVTTNSGGTLVLTFNASATSANVDAVLQSIAYSNASDAPAASVQIDWTFNDGNSGAQGSGGALTATGSTTVSITGENDAPTLSGGPASLGSFVTGAPSNGVLVSTVIAGTTYADPDGAVAQGIAITAVTGTGTWQFSTDNSTWTDFPAVTGTTALLLDSASYVRFSPDPGWTGTASIDFQGWDQITGTASTNGSAQTGNASVNGGTNAYSIGSAVGNMTITNPPPAATPQLDIAASSADSNEGDSGSTAFTFTVTRSVSTSGSSSASYSVMGSGTNPADAADFGGSLPSGTVTFSSGQSSKVITINVSGDTVIESDEGFTLTLSNPSNATIATDSAGGVIRNDDTEQEQVHQYEEGVTPPENTDLTNIFPTLGEDDELGPNSVDLNHAVNVNGQTLLEEMLNTFPQLPLVGDQESDTGSLVVTLGSQAFVFRPTAVSQAPADVPAGLYPTPDGQLLLVTSEGRQVTMTPAMRHPQAVQGLLSTLGVNFIPALNGNGSLLLTQEGGNWFISVAPDIGVSGTSPGTDPRSSTDDRFELAAHPRADGFDIFVFHAQTDAGEEAQPFYPSPLDEVTLRATLEAAGFTDVMLETDGVMRATLNGQTFHALMDYRVDDAAAFEGNIVRFTALGDVNGDGLVDFRVGYPSGGEQVLYLINLQ